MNWYETAAKKIEAKEWEAVEEVWMSAMDGDPTRHEHNMARWTLAGSQHIRT